jgi:hypothetical protein
MGAVHFGDRTPEWRHSNGGTYVWYDHEALTGILALESSRAEARHARTNVAPTNSAPIQALSRPRQTTNPKRLHVPQDLHSAF